MEKPNTETCADRVLAAAQTRFNDLRAMMSPESGDFFLMDDGTLDTVIGFAPTGDEALRIHDATEYRDDTGALDFDALAEDYRDALADYAHERFHEYGLSFEWCEGRDAQSSGFHAFVLSTGGPHEEIRFFSDASGHVYKITFYLADWFDSAAVDVTDFEAAQMLRDDFEECQLFVFEEIR